MRSVARLPPTLAASAGFVVLALIVTGPALLGRVSLGPESVIDADPLFRTAPPPPAPAFNDRSRALIELPRDLTVARGLRAGESGNGTRCRPVARRCGPRAAACSSPSG